MRCLFLLLPLLAACRPEGTTKYTVDADRDGLSKDEDCDDNDDSIGVATTFYTDSDADGHGAGGGDEACEAPTGTSATNDDCDDANATVYPGAEDICDAIDNDCDGVIDNGATSTVYYVDADADGFGDDATAVSGCSAPDGYVEDGGDCNDADVAYHPGADESDCTDPNDYNCDGSVGAVDADADGYAACEECDDGNAANFPGASEYCDDVDNNCDGEIDEVTSVDASTWYADLDADTYGDATNTTAACDAPEGYVGDATDCNDTVEAIHPTAPELCNSIDDDCDGEVDEDATDTTIYYADADGDLYGDDASTTNACAAPSGYVATPGDCDDADAAYNPGVIESDCTDPNDYNCDGSTGYTDADVDGWAACAECDDTNAANFPGATEYCDGVDNDCDSVVDEADAADAATWYADSDADTYGAAASTALGCTAPAGYIADATDCNDAVATINPGQVELCNGLDDDCDGDIDESGVDAPTWYADNDTDGYGEASSTLAECTQPAGYVSNDDDCDDLSSAVSPDATELCDAIDNNCDGNIDEDSAADVATWYADGDSDGYGDGRSTQIDCDQPAGYVADDADCNDADASVSPAGVEVCNSVDDDCNGAVDDDASGGSTFYADTDADGYGDSGSTAVDCTAPTGYISDSADCNDAVYAINPGAEELCNSIDDDCNGTVDDYASDALLWYRDSDADAYGDPRTTEESCAQPSGYVADATDCDDLAVTTYPGASEFCNTVDDDCDGSVDEVPVVSGTTYYADTDGDGYGDALTTTNACSVPSGYTTDTSDCDDGDGAVHPGATDVCDNLDNNCDDYADNGGLCPCTVTYDADGDNYMFCTTARTVAAGRTSCQTYGYDLVAINDATENSYVNATAYSYYAGKWWTGYTDAVSEGTWLWPDGTTGSYTNWHTGEPNNSGSNEDCVQLGRFYPAYTWNDEPCTSSFYYICEG